VRHSRYDGGFLGFNQRRIAQKMRCALVASLCEARVCALPMGATLTSPTERRLQGCGWDRWSRREL